MNRDQEASWWRKNFPNPAARAEADKVIDGLDPKEPMSKFIDTWIEAYHRAGGKRGIR